jgi:hypothetical protein
MPKSLTILITPEARAVLEAEVGRAGASGNLIGGLLFGHPVDEQSRLVASSVRLTSEVGFGRKDFCLDQSRTSQQLAHARKLAREADYCGVWYIHHTPNQELTDAEWVQAQSVLEDPDFHFQDCVCLVLCLYVGKLDVYAFSFDRYQSARGQLAEPALLKSATDVLPISKQVGPASQPVPPPQPTDWYRSPDVARRLEVEHKWLAQEYRVESAVSPNGQVIFRLMPKAEHEDMVFYIACGPGFPDKAPTAFLSIRGDRYPLLSPVLNEWSAEKSLLNVADDLLKWQVRLLDQQVATAQEAFDRGDYKEASDLLVMVLLIDPRKPGAARLLAQAQAQMETDV